MVEKVSVVFPTIQGVLQQIHLWVVPVRSLGEKGASDDPQTYTKARTVSLPL